MPKIYQNQHRLCHKWLIISFTVLCCPLTQSHPSLCFCLFSSHTYCSEHPLVCNHGFAYACHTPSLIHFLLNTRVSTLFLSQDWLPHPFILSYIGFCFFFSRQLWQLLCHERNGGGKPQLVRVCHKSGRFNIRPYDFTDQRWRFDPCQLLRGGKSTAICQLGVV